MLRDFSKEAFDIIIQAGQSNSEGYSFGLADRPYEPSDRVFYLTADYIITPAAELVTGNDLRGNFSLPFAREYLNNGYLKEGRNLLILRTAVGGTGFLDKRWSMDGDLYRRMMEMTKTALELNPENRLVALLWHQGETDACLNATYDVHYQNFSTLVNSVKTEFNTPDLPFVAGDFVHHWKNANIERCTPVIDAIKAVCRDLSCGGFVESDGLTSNLQENKSHPFGWDDDSIHFSRNAIYTLGERYFKCFSEIIKK